jgi:hypothetical protein
MENELEKGILDHIDIIEHVIRMAEIYNITDEEVDQILDFMSYYLGPPKNMYLHSFLKMLEGLGAAANISAKDPEK